MRRSLRSHLYRASSAKPCFQGIAAKSLDDVPASPSAYDDEFASATLNASWTKRGATVWDAVNPMDPYAAFAATGTRFSINSWRPSWIMWQPELAATSQMWITKAYTPPTNVLIWARLSFAFRTLAQPNNDGGIAMGLYKLSGSSIDNNNRAEIFLNESDVNTVQVDAVSTIAGVSTAAVSLNVLDQFQIWEYVALLKVGTQIDFFAGTEAGSWCHIQRATNALAFDAVGLHAYNGTSNSPGNAIVGADFIRFRENVTQLP